MTLDFDVERFRDGVAEIDDLHHESMRTIDSDVRELHAETRKALGGASRRQFLVRSALATGAITIGSQVIPLSSLLAPAAYGDVSDADSTIAAYAASVEYAAVAAYQAAAAKLTNPAILAAATAFATQHKAHGDAFQGASGGKIQKDTPNKTLLTSLATQLSQTRSEMEVVKLAYDTENGAAATYQFALGALKSPDALVLTASILPIEAGHAAVLGMVLYSGDATKDKRWLPGFQTEDGAFAPDKNPIA